MITGMSLSACVLTNICMKAAGNSVLYNNSLEQLSVLCLMIRLCNTPRIFYGFLCILTRGDESSVVTMHVNTCCRVLPALWTLALNVKQRLVRFHRKALFAYSGTFHFLSGE